MVALATPPPVLPTPPGPLSPELRSDLAYGRACGRSWKALAGPLGYDPGALRRAAEADPQYAAALERAWAEVVRKCEAEGLARLRQIAAGDDQRLALKAAEALVRHGLALRRDQTRRAVEKERAEAKVEAARQRAGRADDRGEDGAEPDDGWVTVRVPARVETHEEMALRRDRRAVKESAGEGPLAPQVPEVYLWGGRHATGRCVEPDASDRRVRVVADCSVGVGSRGAVYWVVPAEAVPSIPGGDDYRPEDQPPGDVWAAIRPAAPDG